MANTLARLRVRKNASAPLWRRSARRKSSGTCGVGRRVVGAIPAAVGPGRPPPAPGRSAASGPRARAGRPGRGCASTTRCADGAACSAAASCRRRTGRAWPSIQPQQSASSSASAWVRVCLPVAFLKKRSQTPVERVVMRRPARRPTPAATGRSWCWRGWARGPAPAARASRGDRLAERRPRRRRTPGCCWPCARAGKNAEPRSPRRASGRSKAGLDCTMPVCGQRARRRRRAARRRTTPSNSTLGGSAGSGGKARGAGTASVGVPTVDRRRADGRAEERRRTEHAEHQHARRHRPADRRRALAGLAASCRSPARTATRAPRRTAPR